MLVSATRAQQQDRSQCTPCRGTGSLLSSKGGEPHPVTCPWCGGSGAFQPGRDAQAAGASDAGGAAPAGADSVETT